MKKKIFLITIIIYLVSIINVHATMAHNIYSDPKLNTSDVYDTFMIDFQGVQTPSYTYWALCNWGMDLSKFKQSHSGVNGGGAYAGLQANEPGRRSAIMSFWEVSYDGGQIQRAKMVYPNGETNSFGGEGEGSNYITDYNWQTNNWYRMLLHAWDNPETNTTYMAQWFLDLSTNEWRLISVFDTKLPSSGMTGGFSQFQENYVGTTAKEIREFNFKNMYVRKKSNQLWYSLNTTVLSYDTKAYGYDTAGRHEFGIRNNMFYGLSGGTISNQNQYDKNQPDQQTLSINQPKLPQITNPPVTINVSNINGTATIKWNYNGPQKEYILKIIDNKTNKLINTVSSIKPEKRNLSFNDDSKNHIYELEIKDVFGNTSKVKSTPKDYEIIDDNQPKTNTEEIQEELVNEDEKDNTTKLQNSKNKIENTKRNEYKSTNNVIKQEENKIAYIISYIVIAISFSIIIVSMIYIVNNKKKKNNI